MLYDFTSLWNLKKKMQSLRDRAQTDGCQTWGVVKMGEGGQMYKLPVIR